MTTPDTNAKTSRVQGGFRLPDPPECPEDKMTSFDHLAANGNAHYLAHHLGNPETTLVTGDRYLVVRPTRNLAGSRYPDLLVAFGVDPALPTRPATGTSYRRAGKAAGPGAGGGVGEHGRRLTWERSVRDYAALGIGEYWRFDGTGDHHGARLTGDQLVDGEYVAIDIDELPSGSLQGYSAALNLNILWERGDLVFYDPGHGTAHRHVGR